MQFSSICCFSCLPHTCANSDPPPPSVVYWVIEQPSKSDLIIILSTPQAHGGIIWEIAAATGLQTGWPCSPWWCRKNSGLLWICPRGVALSALREWAPSSDLCLWALANMVMFSLRIPPAQSPNWECDLWCQIVLNAASLPGVKLGLNHPRHVNKPYKMHRFQHKHFFHFYIWESRARFSGFYLWEPQKVKFGKSERSLFFWTCKRLSTHMNSGIPSPEVIAMCSWGKLCRTEIILFLSVWIWDNSWFLVQYFKLKDIL